MQMQWQLHIPKQDIPTRWNSSPYMLHSVVEQRMSLIAYSSDACIPVLTDKRSKT